MPQDACNGWFCSLDFRHIKAHTKQKQIILSEFFYIYKDVAIVDDVFKEKKS